MGMKRELFCTESASSNREPHHSGSRRRENDTEQHKSDTKQEPSTCTGEYLLAI